MGGGETLTTKINRWKKCTGGTQGPLQPGRICFQLQYRRAEAANLQKIHLAHRFVDFRRESLLAIRKYVLLLLLRLIYWQLWFKGEVKHICDDAIMIKFKATSPRGDALGRQKKSRVSGDVDVDVKSDGSSKLGDFLWTDQKSGNLTSRWLLQHVYAFIRLGPQVGSLLHFVRTPSSGFFCSFMSFSISAPKVCKLSWTSRKQKRENMSYLSQHRMNRRGLLFFMMKNHL